MGQIRNLFLSYFGTFWLSERVTAMRISVRVHEMNFYVQMHRVCQERVKVATKCVQVSGACQSSVKVCTSGIMNKPTVS